MNEKPVAAAVELDSDGLPEAPSALETRATALSFPWPAIINVASNMAVCSCAGAMCAGSTPLLRRAAAMRWASPPTAETLPAVDGDMPVASVLLPPSKSSSPHVAACTADELPALADTPLAPAAEAEGVPPLLPPNKSSRSLPAVDAVACGALTDFPRGEGGATDAPNEKPPTDAGCSLGAAAGGAVVTKEKPLVEAGGGGVSAE